MVGSSNFDPVSVANSEVPIFFVCDKAGIDYSFRYNSRSKLYCPFGAISHIDGGQDRAFCIYDETNTAYCYACSAFYTPVGLYQAITDLPMGEAADKLLEEYGWAPETPEDRWARVSAVTEYDNSELATALDRYCSRLDSDWPVLQLSEPYSTEFRKCVQLAAAVKDSSQAIKWLDATKKHMKGVIDAARS